ncbi:MAG: alpha-L-rhamnosidase N-terminal domain-containing protein, partial [Draconibacterium sp.]|nr:alpha-L-rhamnosidase N-terminal domain-containing protein [Draconibacterium sp.]
MILRVCLISLCLISFTGLAQERNIQVNSDWNNQRHEWESSWITHPTASVFDYGVFLFRNKFTVNEISDSITIYVSADNRYRLFINGKEISHGPSRGTLHHWRYETINISSYLKKGENIIAAEVFNLGEHRPVGQLSHKTAFILQAKGELGNQLNTGKVEWKVEKNEAYSAIEVTREMVVDYYVAGPCDSINAKVYPVGWEQLSFNDVRWQSAKNIIKGAGRGFMHGVPWYLVPRKIPHMEQKLVRIPKIARSNQKINRDFLNGTGNFTIPANSNISVLLDQTFLTMGYPEMIVSGGEEASIKVTYAEALLQKDGKKGNRNDIDNKSIKGYYDVFLPDGRNNFKFRPLWLRTYRFIQLDIETKDKPLTIHDFYGIFTAYPLKENASFDCGDEMITKIWDVGWRTARLCAWETYMDCPY